MLWPPPGASGKVWWAGLAGVGVIPGQADDLGPGWGRADGSQKGVGQERVAGHDASKGEKQSSSDDGGVAVCWAEADRAHVLDALVLRPYPKATKQSF